MPKRIKDDELSRAYIDIFLSSDNGKMVLNHILDVCGFWETANTFDGNAISFQNGKRDVALNILNALSYKKRDVMDFINEAHTFKVLPMNGENDNDR